MVPSGRTARLHFAAALLALVGEVSAAALAPEYARAIERDDACIPGDPSCSLVLSQLRASARGGHSSSSERPTAPHVLEAVDADLGLLASGAPAMSAAARMTREGLETAVPGGEASAPAALHSELPWAAAAAREAEKQVAEVEAQAPRWPESQAATFDQAQPQPQLQWLQPKERQAQPEAPAAAAQPTPPQLCHKTCTDAACRVACRQRSQGVAEEAPQSAQQYDVQEYVQPAMPQATQDDVGDDGPDDVALKKERGRLNSARGEIAKDDSDDPESKREKNNLNSAKDDIGEDDSDDVGWKKETETFDSDMFTKEELTAMAGKHGGEVLWDALNPEKAQRDAKPSSNTSVDSSKAALAHFHHSTTRHSKARSHSRAPLSHGKAHKTAGGAKMHAHN